MSVRRASSWLGVLFLAALLAACAYVAGLHPLAERPRTQAALLLASRPTPVPVEFDRIVDGDTFRIFVGLASGELTSTPVRIRGLDTPELHGACEAEIRAAREAARALERLLRGGEVLLERIASDKYDRVLARVLVRGPDARLHDVAEAMVGGGYGRAYDGRKRAAWCG